MAPQDRQEVLSFLEEEVRLDAPGDDIPCTRHPNRAGQFTCVNCKSVVCDRCIHVHGGTVLCDECATRMADNLRVGADFEALQRVQAFLQHPLLLLGISVVFLSIIYGLFVGLVKKAVTWGGSQDLSSYEIQHWALKGFRLRRRAEAFVEFNRGQDAHAHFERMAEAYDVAYELAEEGTQEYRYLVAASAFGREMLGETDEAMRGYKTLIPGEEDEYVADISASFAAYRMGRIYHEVEGSLHRATYYYEMANDLYPSELSFFRSLGPYMREHFLLYVMGVMYDRSEMLYHLMVCYEQRENYEWADDVYNEMARTYPSSEWTERASHPIRE